MHQQDQDRYCNTKWATLAILSTTKNIQFNT